MPSDPNALYAYGQTGIPQEWTQNLMGLGYNPTPFATQDQEFNNQISFQHVLKSILDKQIGAFSPYGVGNNTSMLPFNLRNLFSGASNALQDPTYGIIGAPGFFGGGYQQGDLPQNRSSAYENWWQSAHGYPNVAPPQPLNSGGQQQQVPSHGTNVGSYDVALPGGGSIRVNAGSEAAARQNAASSGYDTSQSNVSTYRQPYTY